MSLAVHVSVESGRAPLAAARIAAIARSTLRAERVREAMLSVTLLPERAMAALNRRHLGHPGATDVISFAFAPAGTGGPVVGDVYICPAVARMNARTNRVGVREELARLVVHGTLHVVGHDHPDGEARQRSPMWRRQERLLARALARGAT
jgi:probable rRNA maturation factor